MSCHASFLFWERFSLLAADAAIPVGSYTECMSRFGWMLANTSNGILSLTALAADNVGVSGKRRSRAVYMGRDGL
ncbi:hypothetical protein HDV57DRAFT_110086 [Trichoderma longibrachiatum]